MNISLENFLQDLQQNLQNREIEGLKRQLSPATGIDFASNDYLGLSKSPKLKERLLSRLPSSAMGSPASRLLRGNHPLHLELERKFADFKSSEAALFYPSGFQANLGLLSTVIKKNDRVLSDALNHASLIDGIRLSRAQKVIYPHCDLNALENELAQSHEEGNTFVVTEALFSMDGDLAPLVEIVELCSKYRALLIVDEAHSTGIYGKNKSSGLIEDLQIDPKNLLAVSSTGGKALGLSGAFITGSQTLIDSLVNHSRSFIYSTAPSPLLALALICALETLEAEQERKTQLFENLDFFHRTLLELGLELPPFVSPIIPIILNDNHLALTVSEELQGQGFDVRALRPPTVPEYTARLRISLHADHTQEELKNLARAITQSMGLGENER